MRADCVCSGIFIHNPTLLLDSNKHYSILTIPCSACVYYLYVFTQLYLRKWGQLLYQIIVQPFFRNARTFHGEGGTPIHKHGRKVLWWWPPFLRLSIQFGPYCIVQPNPIDPLFLQKRINLCISYLVPEICGHKVGRISTGFKDFASMFSILHLIFVLIFDAIDPPFQ